MSNSIERKERDTKEANTGKTNTRGTNIRETSQKEYNRKESSTKKSNVGELWSIEEERWFPAEEDLSEIGQMIYYERRQASVSRQELCEGLCSERFLSLLEAGERGCERILAEALLGRIGVSMSRFLYFLGSEEEKTLLAQERLSQDIQKGEWERLEEDKRAYESCFGKAEHLYRQVLLTAGVAAEWKQFLEEKRNRKQYSEKELSKKLEGWKEKLEQAWELTRDGYPLSDKNLPRMNLRELFIKSLFLRIQEEAGEREEALDGYGRLLKYVKKQAKQYDQMRVYPQIAYRVLLLLRDRSVVDAAGMERTEKAKKAKYLWRESMALLKTQGGLYQLPELLDYAAEGLWEEYEGEPPSRIRRRIEELSEFADLLRWLCEAYQETLPEWDWYFSYGMEEVYRYQDVIKGRRTGYGMSRSELADGICEKREIKRLEEGVATPKKVILVRLMRKLAFPGGNGTPAAQVGDPELWELSGEISDKTMFAEYEGVKEKLEKLKEEKGKNRYIDQRLKELEATTLYSLKEISAEENQKRMWKALHITMPEKGPEELTEWAFMKREAAILNVLAHSYDKLGKQEEGLRWMQLLKEYYERQPFPIEFYRDNYELALRNLGNLLGNIGKYQEAIEVEKVAIALALRTGRWNILRLTLYDIGWNMEHLWAEGTYTKEESRRYIRAALAFAKFYGKEQNIAQIENHLKEVYGEIIEAE